MNKIIQIAFMSLLATSCLSQQPTHPSVLSTSRKLSLRINPKDDSVAIANLYDNIGPWKRKIKLDSLPEFVREAINEGNFCVRQTFDLNYMQRVTVIEVGPVRTFAMSSALTAITTDTAIHNAFEFISRPRDGFYIISLTNLSVSSFYSSMYVEEAYSNLVIKPVEAWRDTSSLFSYLLNESSFGGDYSLETLVIVSTKDNTLKVVFEKPVLDKNHFEHTSYHYIYDLTSSKLIMLRIDEADSTETIEDYIFNGEGYIQTK